ncbi:MAG: choice-of-anchor tandem repeat GloVer-containing protein [Terriglobales bacterium]
MRLKALVMFVVTLAFAASAWASDEAPSAAAASETLLYSFCAQSSCTDGNQPYGSVVADAKGNLYGTTYDGGTNNDGTVYELTKSGGTWTETVLYSFLGATNNDGANPFTGLIFDTAGNLYGVTQNGGASSQGTVFKLTKSGSTWKESVLHTFDNISGDDGSYPYGRLVFDAAGNLYGNTQQGGKFGGGIVFELKKSGSSFTYHPIHSFATSASTSYQPYGGMVIDKNGYLYGTTYYGGVIWNAGSVYQMREVSGVWIFSVIYNFLGDSLGQYSYGDLAADSAGNLYGTTYSGGSFDLGEVFKLTLGKNNAWTESVIHSFQGFAKKDGANPYYAGVTVDADGNVYGSTYQGGSSTANNLNYGTVYKLTAGTYKESVLWSFGTSGDGYYPLHEPIVVDGKLYGTTYVGGAHNGGAVYEVVP